MFAVAGSEFVWWRKNTWTRYRPCLTCQMVIKIHIYISKEGHMAGKSFTPLTKKNHIQQWYCTYKENIFRGAQKNVFLLNIINTKLNTSTTQDALLNHQDNIIRIFFLLCTDLLYSSNICLQYVSMAMLLTTTQQEHVYRRQSEAAGQTSSDS